MYTVFNTVVTGISSKHDNQFWLNVEPASEMVGQHSANIGSTLCLLGVSLHDICAAFLLIILGFTGLCKRCIHLS